MVNTSWNVGWLTDLSLIPWSVPLTSRPSRRVAASIAVPDGDDSLRRCSRYAQLHRRL